MTDLTDTEALAIYRDEARRLRNEIQGLLTINTRLLAKGSELQERWILCAALRAILQAG